MQVLTSGDRTPISRVSLSGCGRWLLAARPRKVAILWDRTTGRVARRFAHLPMAGAMVHPDGRCVLVWGPGGLLVIGIGDRAERRAEPREPVYWLGADAAGRRLVTAVEGDDSTHPLVGWRTADDHHPLVDWRMPTGERMADPLAIGRGPTTALAMAPAGHLFVVANDLGDGTLTLAIRSGTDGAVLARGTGPTGFALRGLTDSGRVLLSWGQELSAWDLAADQEVAHVLPSGAGPIRGAAVSADGGQVVVAAAKAVLFLAADTLAVRRTYTFPMAGKPTCVAFAPDGLTAACGTSKGEVVIWDVD